MKERIIFLLLASVILIGTFALISPANDEPEQHDVTVAVATDLHYIAPSLTDNGEFFTELVTDADGKVMLYIDELVRAFAAQIAREQPDALILSGDLTFNGETLSHETLAGILAEIEAAGVPVYVMPGNHDMLNSMAAKFSGGGYELTDSPSESEFAGIYADFGYSEAISRDSASLSYTARLAPGLRLVMLDVNTRSDPGWVLDGTLEWLEAQLAEAKAAGERVIAVSHQNLYAHNPLFTDGYLIGNGGALHSLYTEYGVLCNLAGHIHLQHTYEYEGLREIVTSSLAVNPNQYGLLTVSADGCDYSTESVDVSAWASEQGLDDENLLDFAAYSEGFFYDTAVAQGLDALGGAENAAELAGFYARVNTLYFAGRGDLIEWDEALASGWDGHGYMIPVYLGTIRSDAGTDHTHLSWSFAGAA